MKKTIQDMGEFSKRRKRLFKLMGKNSLVILPAAAVCQRNSDVEYAYRQDSDFHYLSNFPEPEAVIVLRVGSRGGEYFLFCRPSNAEAERWVGAYAGLQGASDLYGADQAFDIKDFDVELEKLMQGCVRVFFNLGRDEKFDQRVVRVISQLKKRARSGINPPDEILALDKLLHELRLKKSPAEISLMKKAVTISVAAHRRVMASCAPDVFEHQLEAEFIYACSSAGARFQAYPAIVAGAGNSCILHYTANQNRLQSGDLLLIDAGCEYQHYASDITRSYPVNGVFSATQALIYNIVLRAQQAAIAKIKPGNQWIAPHQAALRVITQGLLEVGLLKGKLNTLIKDKAYRRFYMHNTGHWLGLDVHDVGRYKESDKTWRRFEPGMVLTVEPGIYIPAGSRGIAKKWWNIGIRIEDDVLVTAQGCDVLSAALPKTISQLEDAMSAAI